MALSEEFKLDFKFGGNSEFLTRLESLMQRIDDKFNSVDESITDAAKSTEVMADSVRDLDRAFGGSLGTLSEFGNRLKSIVGYYISFRSISTGINRVWSMGREGMDAYSTQERAENQLKGVLKNRGNLDQFQLIKDYAAEIQGRSIYGDEAMIKAAGELATYVKGTSSLKSMMDLLTDYAAGMTGGGEVSPEQMESLATGLGMAYDGNYTAMRRKGFDTSKLEALDAIVENGGRWGAKEKNKYGDVLDPELLKEIKKYGGVTEQMRVDALKESLGDWNGLADTVNDLSSSAIVKFNNKLGDLRENLGNKIYPVFNNLVEKIDENMPLIERFFGDISEIFSSMVSAMADNIPELISFGKGLMTIVTQFSKGAISVGALFNKFIGFKEAIIALTGAMALEKVYEFVKAIKVATITMAGAEGASAAGGLTGALGKLRGAMNTTVGKMALLGGALWGIQKIAQLITVAYDAYKADEYAKEGQKEGKLSEEEFKKNADIKDRIRLLEKQRDRINAKYPNDFIIDEFGLDDPREQERRYDYNRLKSINNELVKLGIDETRTRNQAKEHRRKSEAAFARINSLQNPMDDIMKEAEKTAKAIENIKTDAKGDTSIYNNVRNTHIEQKVSIAADMQKIGILLNQNIRSIIEKQMRQNREVGISTGI